MKCVDKILAMKKISLHCKDIPSVSEICWNCLYFGGKSPADRTCKAFPGGIPLKIWLGENDHTKPFPNDNGFRFVPFKFKG
jgi:hypothetical protein